MQNWYRCRTRLVLYRMTSEVLKCHRPQTNRQHHVWVRSSDVTHATTFSGPFVIFTFVVRQLDASVLKITFRVVDCLVQLSASLGSAQLQPIFS